MKMCSRHTDSVDNPFAIEIALYTQAAASWTEKINNSASDKKTLGKYYAHAIPHFVNASNLHIIIIISSIMFSLFHYISTEQW